MRALRKNPAPRLPITRLFESSRLQGTDLATAFEHALPMIRRTIGQPLLPRADADRHHFAKRASS